MSCIRAVSRALPLLPLRHFHAVPNESFQVINLNSLGTCLTITEFDAHSFKVGVSPETLRRTNLGSLESSSHVNLERAVSASTRMGGHFVQGHVDTIATILSITPDGNALTFRLQPRDTDVLKYIVEKGYVALDGTSLTITKVVEESENNSGWWEIMLIAYSQEKVVMAQKSVGDAVNVEVDMLGKYVDKCVRVYLKENKGQPSAPLQNLIGNYEGRVANS